MKGFVLTLAFLAILFVGLVLTDDEPPTWHEVREVARVAVGIRCGPQGIWLPPRCEK